MVEERFDLDYAVALGVAGALVLLIASVGLALAVMRCRNRAREARQRQQHHHHHNHARKGSACGSNCNSAMSSPGNGVAGACANKEGRAAMIRSRSGGEVSCSDSMSTQVRQKPSHCFS